MLPSGDPPANVVVIGGGPAGLTAAWELVRYGVRPIVLEKGTEMLVAGDVTAVARSLDAEHSDGAIELPGVMSRKKEVAPKLMTAL